MSEESLLHSGHRQRMREKLFTYGSKVMHSYELLEMLLFYAVQYKNTNPIAKRLMQRFGSLDGVFSASREQLCEIEGVGEKTADFLISVGEFFKSDSTREEAAPLPALNTYPLVGEYLVDKLSALKEYRVLMLLFDSDMTLLGCDVMYSDDYSFAAVRASHLVETALKKRASIVITAHNHPFGPLFPTPGDMATNSAVEEAFKKVGIMHIEHYVICGSEYTGIKYRFSISLGQFSPYRSFFDKT